MRFAVKIQFYTMTLSKICQNLGFLWSTFSRRRTECLILLLYGKMGVKENLYTGIYYAVSLCYVIPFNFSKISQLGRKSPISCLRQHHFFKLWERNNCHSTFRLLRNIFPPGIFDFFGKFSLKLLAFENRCAYVKITQKMQINWAVSIWWEQYSQVD